MVSIDIHKCGGVKALIQLSALWQSWAGAASHVSSWLPPGSGWRSQRERRGYSGWQFPWGAQFLHLYRHDKTIS